MRSKSSKVRKEAIEVDNYEVTTLQKGVLIASSKQISTS